MKSQYPFGLSLSKPIHPSTSSGRTDFKLHMAASIGLLFTFALWERGGVRVRVQRIIPLSKTDEGMIVFPFDTIHVDFMLKAA